jgi:cobalt-zinc-cadmium resistance protein CzcA
MPALATWFLGGRIKEGDGLIVRAAKSLYRPVLSWALRMKMVVGIGAVLLFGGSVWLFLRLGAEFIPQLDEGSLAIQMIRGNSVALGDSVTLQRESEELLMRKFPEISHVFARIGTAEIATDPMGPNVSDTYVFLHPKSEWRKIDGRTATKEQLVELMRHELVGTIPGQTYLFTQPIQMRFNELMAGARADLSLKIFGDDLAELERIAGEARDVLRSIPGGGDVEFDALGRTPMLEITPRRDALERLNLHADEINDVIATALAGEEAGVLVDGNRRTGVVVRLPEARRLNVAGLGELPVITKDYVHVPLSRIAQISVVDRVGTITRENTLRRVAVLINVRGRDTESFVKEAGARLHEELKLPAGYYVEFGGQFENLQAARTRLAILVPATLAMIFVLIYASFGSARQALLVFTGIPLAVTGGVLALWLRGIPFSISAGVGFIALSGVAVLNGVMIVSFFNQLRERGHTVRESVLEGALIRLRPVMMTAFVASLGFLPMAIATGPGAEVQRPLATVVIGGIISATFLTLVLLPALYDFFERDTKPVQQ